MKKAFNVVHLQAATLLLQVGVILTCAPRKNSIDLAQYCQISKLDKELPFVLNNLNYSDSSCTIKSKKSSQTNDQTLASNVTDWSSTSRLKSEKESDLGKFLSEVEEPYAWRLNYLEEQTNSEFNPIFRESSFDERLSNIVYTVHTVKVFNTDSNLINTGNKEKDLVTLLKSADSNVDDRKCGQHLRAILSLYEETSDLIKKKKEKRLQMNSNMNNYVQKFINEEQIRLAHFLDSFGHYDAGLMSGKTSFMGSYNQCKRSSLILEDQRVLSRFCTARLSIDKYLNQELKRRPKPEKESSSLIDVGICLPESCHSKSLLSHRSLIQRIVDSQFKLPKEFFMQENLPLKSLFCEIQKDSQLNRLPLSGKLCLLFLICWVSITICFTSDKFWLINLTKIDKQKKTSINRLINYTSMCLNLKKSWNDFTEMEQSSKDRHSERINLDVLNPIKVLCGFIVVMGHSFIVVSTSNMDLFWSYNSSENDPIMGFMMSATFTTDTFYVISGLLISYISMTKLKKHYKNNDFSDGLVNSIWKFSKHSSQIIISRYLRLVPLYAIVYWFHRSLFLNLSSGPTWDKGYNRNTLAGSCRQESWLTPFTYRAAYMPLSRQCLPPTWSVAGDLFFVLFIGPIIVLMMKKPKLAISLSIILSCLSCSLMYRRTSAIEGILKKSMAELKYIAFVLIYANASDLYTAPHYRIFSIIIGVLAGYWIYRYNETKNDDDDDDWKSCLVGWPSKTATYFILIMLTLPSLVILLKSNLLSYVPLHEYLIDAPLSFGRLLWSLSNAVLFCRMITDWKDTYLMKNFTTNFWRCLAKLSYSILLIHMDVIYYDTYSELTIPFFSRYAIIKIGFYTYLISCIIGVFMHVVFENPMNKLLKWYKYK